MPDPEFTRPGRDPAPRAGRRTATVRDRVRGTRARARVMVAALADRIAEIAPRIPVRDLATLRRQFPEVPPEELADLLVAGAARGTSAVGAGLGAAAMLPTPPAMPAELAAEVTGVAALELKLIAELYEVYGRRPPGSRKERTAVYLNAWADERGVDVIKPWTLSTALGGQLKRELRQQITKRLVRNVPALAPFMVGAAVGAVMNHRETKRLAERIRRDLRRHQVVWEDLPDLPALEEPADVLPPEALPGATGPSPVPESVTDADAQPVTDADAQSVTDADAESDTGAEAGADTGMDTGTDAEADADADRPDCADRTGRRRDTGPAGE